MNRVSLTVQKEFKSLRHPHTSESLVQLVFMFAAGPREHSAESEEEYEADNLEDKSSLHDVQSLLLEVEIVCHSNYNASPGLEE